MSKRTVSEIKSEIDEAVNLYRENVDKWNRAEIAKSNEKVKSLQNEMSDTISKGADPCPNCGSKPIGIIRREVPVGNTNIPVYEVGCSVCAPEETKGKRKFYAAHGGSPQDAVSNWNTGQFVEK